MKKQQEGLTLLELLIAVALGLVIISGVIRLAGRTMDAERFSAADSEITETMNYVSNRLGFIFRSSMSSPCGSLSAMMENGSLRRARVNGRAQLIPNVVISRNENEDTVRAEEFPLLAVGIAGHQNEPKTIVFDANGRPKGDAKFSSLLSNIVEGTQYLIVMETSEKLIFTLPKNSSIKPDMLVKKMTGSAQLAKNGDENLLDTFIDGIPVSNVSTRLGKKPPAFIITDCKTADIFYNPSADSQANNLVELPSDMNFSVGYSATESIISPVEMYAYFISEKNGVRSLSRANLTLEGKSEPLVSGVSDLKFEWGFGDMRTAIVQTYFTTEQLLDKKVGIKTFLDSVISVRVEITAHGVNANYDKGTNKQGEIMLNDDGSLKPMEKTVTRVYTLRNKMSRN